MRSVDPASKTFVVPQTNFVFPPTKIVDQKLKFIDLPTISVLISSTNFDFFGSPDVMQWIYKHAAQEDLSFMQRGSFF